MQEAMIILQEAITEIAYEKREILFTSDGHLRRYEFFR